MKRTIYLHIPELPDKYRIITCDGIHIINIAAKESKVVYLIQWIKLNGNGKQETKANA